MYKIFGSIAPEIRQCAFDRLCQEGYGKVLPDGTGARYVNDTQSALWVCPLGAVNRCYKELENITKIRKPLTQPNPFSGELPEKEMFVSYYVSVQMPADGEEAHDILGLVGINIDSMDAQEFIDDNDLGMLLDLCDLATAMGAKYEPANQ
jgi:hypothetical protein